MKYLHHLSSEIFDSNLLKTVIKLTVFIIGKCKITVTFFLNLSQKIKQNWFISINCGGNC